jgi:hypothetical protein
MSTTAIYLDDIRFPKTTDKDWVILRSSAEAIDYVQQHGLTSFVSLDHDLGGDDTTMIFLKWLIEYDLDNDGKIIPADFSWFIHSANTVGSANMDGLLTSYMKTKDIFHLAG